MANLAVIKDNDRALLGSARPSGVLRVREVKAAFAVARGRALDGLAVGVNRLEQLLFQTVLPTHGRSKNPLHLLVAADLHHALVASGNDDRIVRRIVCNRVDVRPVAARTDACSVTERCERFGTHALTLSIQVNVHADGAEVEILNQSVARRIQNGVQIPFVNHVAGTVDFDDEVAHGLNDLTVRTMVAVLGSTQQHMTVGHFPGSMAQINVARRQFVLGHDAAGQIEFDPALALNERVGAGLGREEAHRVAAIGNVVVDAVVDGFGFEPPTEFALRVNHVIQRNRFESERTAGGVSRTLTHLGRLGHDPVDFGALGRTRAGVNEIQTVLELGIKLGDLGLRQSRDVAVVHIGHRERRRQDAVRVGNLLAIKLVAHDNRVAIVGIESKHGNAVVGKQRRATDVVGDVDASVGLALNSHFDIRRLLGVAIDNSRQRRVAVGVDDHIAQMRSFRSGSGRHGFGTGSH